MPAYAIAHLRTVDVNAEIARYLSEIDATLEPYDGRFIIHGGTITEIEGAWPGALIVIEFPTRERAEAWYASDAYQAILPLRTNNAEGSAIIVDGVGPGHRATDLIPASG
jgi:uncharacterized protein (DUF1330 family)